MITFKKYIHNKNYYLAYYDSEIEQNKENSFFGIAKKNNFNYDDYKDIIEIFLIDNKINFNEINKLDSDYKIRPSYFLDINMLVQKPFEFLAIEDYTLEMYNWLAECYISKFRQIK